MNLFSPESIAAAAANGYDLVFGGGVGDLRRTPAQILAEGEHRTLYRYRLPERFVARGAPVLLVPPLAAPTTCFDLRRGCSLAAHLIDEGHPAYLVDYGEIGFSDRELGLEAWVQDIIPSTIEAVLADSGAPEVQLLGWCLGGIMSLLTVAADPRLRVGAVAAIASPFDFTKVPMVAPLRPLLEGEGGTLITALYRLLGGAPAPLVRAGYQLAGLDKYLRKPFTVAAHLDDRDFLAQIEAVDDFTANMVAYPGRTFGQLYHRFFVVNELAAGTLRLADRQIELAKVRVPVLAVAGTGDGIAPVGACRPIVDLLPNAPEVRFETAPGGHLGVLAGRAARRTTWVYIDEFFARRGPAAPAKSRPARRAAA